MTVLLFFFTITAILNVWNGAISLDLARQSRDKAPMESTFAEWHADMELKGRPSGFMDYSFKIFDETQRLTMGQANVVLAYGSIAVATMDIAAWLLVAYALWCWDQFHASRRVLVKAWAATVIAPFLAGMVPARLFVNWDPAIGVVQLYHKELVKVIGADERIGQIRDACNEVRIEKGTGARIANAKNIFGKICHIVEYMPEGSVKWPRSGWRL